MNGPILMKTWEEFVYEISALGFCYDPKTRAWHREDGATASDEALRDLHSIWPVFASATLKLYAKGNKSVSVEAAWENDTFVARLKAVE